MFIGNNYISKTPFTQSSTIQEMFTKHLLCNWLMLGGARDTLLRKTPWYCPHRTPSPVGRHICPQTVMTRVCRLRWGSPEGCGTQGGA